MPATKCSACDQAHAMSYRTQHAGPKCIYHDPDLRVARRLHGHDGLPYDCPGCLAHASIERRAYGRGRKTWLLTCRECGAEYFWLEGRDSIAK